MFDFLFVPTTGSVLKQFVKMKSKLDKVLVYHEIRKTNAMQSLVEADAEIQSAHKARAAVEQFV